MKYVENKVVLIGAGAVGIAYSYALVNQGICDELVIVDIDQTRTRGEVTDLNHCEAWAPSPITISQGGYEDCKDAAMVVICAGAAQRPGQSRLDLVNTNVRIFKDIVGHVMRSGFDGIFLVATNPVDILTYATWRISGLPKEQVLGSGTALDTARLRYNLAQYFEVSTVNVHALIIGEHGDTELPVWSSASIAGRSLEKRIQAHPQIAKDIEEIYVRTRDAAYDIIADKGSTSYGIGMTLAHITRTILGNQKIALPVSVLLEGEYGQEGIYIGVPASLGRKGVREVREIDLNEREEGQFRRSATTLRAVLDQIDFSV